LFFELEHVFKGKKKTSFLCRLPLAMPFYPPITHSLTPQIEFMRLALCEISSRIGVITWPWIRPDVVVPKTAVQN